MDLKYGKNIISLKVIVSGSIRPGCRGIRRGRAARRTAAAPTLCGRGALRCQLGVQLPSSIFHRHHAKLYTLSAAQPGLEVRLHRTRLGRRRDHFGDLGLLLRRGLLVMRMGILAIKLPPTHVDAILLVRMQMGKQPFPPCGKRNLRLEDLAR